jgi:serine/threonine protein kinase
LEKISEILADCLEMKTSERRKYLNKSDIEPEIRAEVKSFLDLETDTETFMSLSAVDVSKDFIPLSRNDDNQSAARQIGIYKVIKELGLGGMGAVYLAERTDGKFKQKVAVKLLKREFNIEKIRQIFKREKEILAALSHPNIAHLLDAGKTDDGIPYLVMEYIEGVPVDKFCFENSLELNERLKLFNKICEAVAFAHRNLVIHRDLKPSNILITKTGETKLLDFGISKLLGETGESSKNTTIFEAMTPQYASPEQIRGEQVSTATDIYSLGVVLFKMLTGTFPYDLGNKTANELLQIIERQEPIMPSSAVSREETNRKSKIA